MLTQRIILMILVVTGVVTYTIYVPKLVAVNQASGSLESVNQKKIIQPLDFEPKGKVLSQKGIYDAIDEPSKVRVVNAQLSPSQLDRKVDEALEKIRKNKLLGDDRYEHLFKYPLDNRVPPKDAVNISKMVKFFNYAPLALNDDQAYGLSIEVIPAPWEPHSYLSFVKLQKSLNAINEYPTTHLVFLIDASGSMIASGNLGRIKNALHDIVASMKEVEEIGIVTYGHAGSGLVLPLTSSAQKEVVYEAIDQLDIKAQRQDIGGLKLAYELFDQKDLPNSNRMVVVITSINNDLCACSNQEIDELIKNHFINGVSTSFVSLTEAGVVDSRRDQMASLTNSIASYVPLNEDLFNIIKRHWRGTKPLLPKSLGIDVTYHSIHVKNISSWVNDSNLRIDEFQISGPLNNDDELFKVKITDQQHIIKFSDIVITGSADVRFMAGLIEFGAILRDDPRKGNATFDQVMELASGALGNPPNQQRQHFLKLVTDTKRLADVKSHP